MKNNFIIRFIYLFLFLCVGFLLSRDQPRTIKLDKMRFTLNTVQDTLIITDNFLHNNISISMEQIFASGDNPKDEESYISSFIFSERINSFEIGNGLTGLQIGSFDAMKSGSAQAAAGRDLFLIYDQQNSIIITTKLDFGITKQRNRYMGCLFAITSHFVLEDVNKDGFPDIGRIKEEMKCDVQMEDLLSEVYFIQSEPQWYLFSDSSWTSSPLKNKPGNYTDLPLIDIQLTPVDFFANIKWKSYDPKNWNSKSKVYFYPQYRIELINQKK